mmetsp:Transcript_57288/g.167667  ORF Transcript_57288/g.167667 Transcript_57288/m.167667 type:complete len:102 (+) Transcript_57288:260-565(+)
MGGLLNKPDLQGLLCQNTRSWTATKQEPQTRTRVGAGVTGSMLASGFSARRSDPCLTRRARWSGIDSPTFYTPMAHIPAPSNFDRSVSKASLARSLLLLPF